MLGVTPQQCSLSPAAIPPKTPNSGVCKHILLMGADPNLHPQRDGSNHTHPNTANSTHANPCTAPRTFAQHAAQGELLLRDEHILQFVLQFITDAQAVHWWGERRGTLVLNPNPSLPPPLQTPATEQRQVSLALPQLEWRPPQDKVCVSFPYCVLGTHHIGQIKELVKGTQIGVQGTPFCPRRFPTTHAWPQCVQAFPD